MKELFIKSLKYIPSILLLWAMEFVFLLMLLR